MRVNLIAANDAPDGITLDTLTVAENSAGATVGNLITSDVDTGDSHTYTVSDNRFEVVGNQLKLKDGVSLDYETENTVALTVTSTDAAGANKAQSLTLNVTDVNDAPVLTEYR